MNKTFLFGVISVLLILSASLYIFINDSSTQKIVISNDDSNKSIVNNNALTMMYETEAGSGEYQVSSDTMWPQDGYIFNETLSKCENGGKLTWDDQNKKVLLQTNTSDKCYIYFDAVYSAAMMITDLFNQGSNELANLDPDGNIRYTGTDPNNYVLFNNELWRIIGVFNNKLKIIKATYIPVIFEDNGVIIGDTSEYWVGSSLIASANFFYWDYNGTNNWETSTLNRYLNGTYYNSIEQNSKKLIDKATWYLGGFSEFLENANQFYEIERANVVYQGNPLTTNNYIGLVYPSDLLYGSSPALIYDNYYNSSYFNWIMNYGLWTISSMATNNNEAIAFFAGGWYSYGYFTTNENDDYYAKENYPTVYPTLYLKSTTNIISGNGSEENPYILA